MLPGMGNELERAARYLDKAAQLRAAAENDKHAAVREALLEVARTYERLADTMNLIHESSEIGARHGRAPRKAEKPPRS